MLPAVEIMFSMFASKFVLPLNLKRKKREEKPKSENLVCLTTLLCLVLLRPQNGSMILYNRKKVKYRKDGYCWKKRKDGKTTREDHMKLKVQGVEVRPATQAPPPPCTGPPCYLRVSGPLPSSPGTCPYFPSSPALPRSSSEG